MSKLDNGNVDYISMESITNNGINMEPKYQGYYETTMIRKDKLVEKFDSNEELYWGRQWYNCDYVSILSDKYAKLYSKSCTTMIPYVEFSWYDYILSYFKFLIFW